jgi:hypothetical protein
MLPNQAIASTPSALRPSGATPSFLPELLQSIKAAMRPKSAHSVVLHIRYNHKTESLLSLFIKLPFLLSAVLHASQPTCPGKHHNGLRYKLIM